VVNSVSFQALMPEQTEFTVVLPKDFADASKRTLVNADSFPLKVATGPMPPLAKFAAAPFGIVERFAEKDGVALLPVTLRNVEAALRVEALNPAEQGKVSQIRPNSDAEIIAWFAKLNTYEANSITRQKAELTSYMTLPKPLKGEDESSVETRRVSLLVGHPGIKTLDLPKPANADPRPFEVVGS
jgi:alpha-2-macroglobulin